jgi:hypothetical protein
MTTTLTADLNFGLTPAEHQARLDALAEQSVRAAETYGVPSPQHDAAMDAHSEYEWEHAPAPQTELMSRDAVSKTAPSSPNGPALDRPTARTHLYAYVDQLGETAS